MTDVAPQRGAAGPLVRLGCDAQMPEGFVIGSTQDVKAATGCTVVLCEKGAAGGVSVLGAAPATRETDLLRPENAVDVVHGLVLSGGSAYGLDAASGVMAFLEEKGRGVSFSGMTVPIVVGASLFDLNVGDGSVRPDAAMGYAAAQAAATTTAVGNVGAGCGASVGKLLGPAMSMKGGLGAASITLSGVAGTDTVTVSAVVAVNALGCIYDRAAHLPNQPIAGVLDPSQRTHGRLHVLDGLQAIMRLAATSAADEDGAGSANAMLGANTTIGCILTDARLAKTQAARVSVMAHDGLARAIDPVHTGFDGDAVFCLASGSAGEGAQPDVIGAFAALVMELAVVNAARAAQSAYGLLAASDLV